MAQGFHEDSCSMTAQTKGASSFCAAAALRASATSSGGAVKGVFLVTRRTRCRPRQVRRAGECHGGSAAAMAGEIHKMHEGRFGHANSLLVGDLAKRGVDVRQMSDREIAHEGVNNLVIAHAAVQPAEKERELHEAGNRRGEKAVPMERHGRLGSD